MKKENMRKKWEKAPDWFNIEKCTCNDCPDKKTCKYAFDLYNTRGDCLASK